jgi:hypothetical protein
VVEFTITIEQATLEKVGLIGPYTQFDVNLSNFCVSTLGSRQPTPTSLNPITTWSTPVVSSGYYGAGKNKSAPGGTD